MIKNAFYGVEFIAFNSSNTLDDFLKVLAMTLIGQPKYWNLIKMVFEDLDYSLRDYNEKRFVLIFNELICDEDLSELIAQFAFMKTTQLEGLSI